MEFNHSLAGKTFFGRVLLNTPPEDRRAVLEMFDWKMPDTGALPVPLHYDNWGMEVLFNHPLATVATLGDDELFIQALEIAHKQQSEEIYLKNDGRGDRRLTSLSDWVACGVLKATLQYGSPTMVKALLDKLEQREKLTTKWIYATPNNPLPYPCPYMGLAQSERGVEDAKKKIKLSHQFLEKQVRATILSPNVRQSNKMVRDIIKQSNKMFLLRAITSGNTEVIDAIFQVNSGSLPSDFFMPSCFKDACWKNNATALVHAMDLSDFNAKAWVEEFNLDQWHLAALIERISNYANEAMLRAHPEVFTGSPNLHGMNMTLEKAQDEYQSIQKVAKILLPSLLSEEHGLSAMYLMPAFIHLPREDVQSVFEQIKPLLDHFEFTAFPDLPQWLNIHAFAPTPWIEQIKSFIGELDDERGSAYATMFGKSLKMYWTGCLKDERLDETELMEKRISHSIAAANHFYSTLPQSARPENDFMSWMGKLIETYKDNEKIVITRLLLSSVVPEQPRRSTPKTKM